MSLLRVPVLVMETGSQPVQAGGDGAGWVSGNPANLAPSGNVTVVFDLGPDWDQYPIGQIVFAFYSPATSANPVQFSGSSHTGFNSNRRMGCEGATGQATNYFNFNIASGPQGFIFRPMGRYVVVQVTNGDAANAFGSGSKITLAVYPS